MATQSPQEKLPVASGALVSGLRRMTMTILRMGAVLGMVWGTLLILLYVTQDAVLFAGQGRGASNPVRDRSDAISVYLTDITLHGWLIERPGAVGTVIYYGGNGEAVGRRLSAIARADAWNTLVMPYRGYGANAGSPSEATLVSDALAIFDKLSSRGRLVPARTVLMGRSLGSGVAVQVAARRTIAGLILVTPMDSIAAVAQTHYPIFPAAWLVRHPFRSIDHAGAVTAPTLIVKAEHDAVIPHRHTDALIEAWRAPLTVVTVPGATHNRLGGPDYATAIAQFLAAIAP